MEIFERQNLPPKFPRRQVEPSGDDLKLRCGVCAGMHFEIHVRPALGLAVITNIVCLTCSKIRRVHDQPVIEGSGTISFEPRAEWTRGG